MRAEWCRCDVLPRRSFVVHHAPIRPSLAHHMSSFHGTCPVSSGQRLTKPLLVVNVPITFQGCRASYDALTAYCWGKNQSHAIDQRSTVHVASHITFDPFLLDLMATWGAGAKVYNRRNTNGGGGRTVRCNRYGIQFDVRLDSKFWFGGARAPSPRLDTYVYTKNPVEYVTWHCRSLRRVRSRILIMGCWTASEVGP